MTNEIRGTRNDDEIFGTDEADIIYGREGNDLIEGQEGDDVLIGGVGWDTLIGGAGDDLLIDDDASSGSGYRGASMFGGEGDDTYDLTANDLDRSAAFSIIEEIGEGFDTIRFHGLRVEDLVITDFADSLRFNFYDQQGQKIASATFATEFIEPVDRIRDVHGGFDFFERYERIEFDDGTVLDATTGLPFNSLDGASGLVKGTRAGDDLYGDFDGIGGYGGDDTFHLGPATRASGGFGNDTFIVTRGADVDTRSSAAIYDEFGQGYDKVVFDGLLPGQVRLHTYEYRDTMYVSLAVPKDGDGRHEISIYDTTLETLFSRIERFEFADGTAWSTMSGFTARNVDGGVTSVGSGADDILNGTDRTDALAGRFGNDLINAGAGDDLLYGGHGDDQLFGGDGDDDLSGGGGNDILFGGAGDDRLDGGHGDDILVFEGAGSGSLIGGTGQDVFVIESGTGNIVIEDFRPGYDLIDLGELGGPKSYFELLAQSSEEDGSTTVSLDDGHTLCLQNVTMGTLSANDFVF